MYPFFLALFLSLQVIALRVTSKWIKRGRETGKGWEGQGKGGRGKEGRRLQVLTYRTANQMSTQPRDEEDEATVIPEASEQRPLKLNVPKT